MPATTGRVKAIYANKDGFRVRLQGSEQPYRLINRDYPNYETMVSLAIFAATTRDNVKIYYHDEEDSPSRLTSIEVAT